MQNKKGFTLVEMMVVVMIIAIIAMMGVPQYKKLMERQKGNEAIQILGAIGRAQARYFAINEVYSSNLQSLDVDLTTLDGTAATGNTMQTKDFGIILRPTFVVASRSNAEGYGLLLHYATGEVCCRHKTDADFCDIFNLPPVTDSAAYAVCKTL